MKAWILDSLTGLSALRFADVPAPQVSPGHVLLNVRLASLNPADRYLAENQYPAKPALPHILGRDGVGEVVAVGEGVSDVRVGQIKAILRGEAGVSRPGTFAEQVCVPADALVDVPAGWSHEQAAGAPLVYLTAYQALTQWSDLRPGGVVLITGASGGVGVASIQLARAAGFLPVGLSRDEAKWKTLRDIGAAAVLSPEDPAWTDKLYAEFGKRPVALAIDNIAGPLFPKVIDTLGQDGRISVVGRLGGPVPEFNTGSLFFRRLRVGGVAVGVYDGPGARNAWHELLALLGRTGASPLIDRAFPFDELPAAFARLKGGPLGKVLLKVAR